MSALVGKTITAVYLAADKSAIKFDVEGGDPIVAIAYGDCCSTTWIECVEAAELLIGSPVLSIDDLEMPDRSEDYPDRECVAFYGCRIRTFLGDATIDYRNESNGYYGGDILWPEDYAYSREFCPVEGWTKLA